MEEDDLLELWNTKRSQVIHAQIAPTLMLIGVFVVAAFGKFETEQKSQFSCPLESLKMKTSRSLVVR